MPPSDFIEIIYDDDWNIIGAKKYFPSGPSVPAPNPELATIVYLMQPEFSFELGSKPAVGGKNPTLGTGGRLAWYTRDEFSNGTRINLQIYVKSISGTSGVGTGSYELYLPEEITPPEEYYSGHANLHIAGGGISEFDGSVKWTFRNKEKGPKLIFTFGGREWTANDPKPYNDFKLRANIRYFL